MADELKHKTVGTELTQAEWEFVGGHIFNSQAAGDILVATSATQLSRLAKGADGKLLIMAAGAPAWGDTPAHKTSHQNDGDDEISVAGLSGELADNQPPKAHLLGSHTQDTLANLNTKISDATLDDSSDTRTPSAHKTLHQSGGADALCVDNLSGELADVQKSKCMVLTFFIPTADISVGDNVTYEIYAPCNLTIDKVYIHAKVAPGTGKTVTIDVDKGGTTIFTTQGGRPTITAAGKADESNTPDVTSVSKNDIITIDIDVATADHETEDMTVQVRCVQV